MDRIFESNVSATPPAPGTATGFPTDGDLNAGLAPTVPGAYWFHQQTEEPRNLILDAGLEPDVENLHQVSQAVHAIATTLANAAQAAAIAEAGTLATAAENAAIAQAQTLATAAENAAIAQASTLATEAENGAVAQAETLANAAQAAAITQAGVLASAAEAAALAAVLSWFTTGQTLGSSIVQPLPGGLMLMIGTYTAAESDQPYVVTLPDTFPHVHLAALASVLWDGNVAGSFSAYATPGSVNTVVLTGDVSSGSAENIPITYFCLGK